MMKYADYYTHMLVFLCDKCKGPAPVIFTRPGPPGKLEGLIKVKCSGGHVMHKPESGAVHVVELAFQNGECFLLRNDTRLPQGCG